MSEPRITIRLDDQAERRFSRPFTAARFLLSLCSAEEMQSLKLDGLRTLQQRMPVVTHVGEPVPVAVAVPGKVLRVREPEPPNSGDLS